MVKKQAVVVPPTEPVATPAVAEKETKKTKTPVVKKDAPVDKVPVVPPTTPVVAPATPAEPVDDKDDTPNDNVIGNVLEKLNTLSSNIKCLQVSLKAFIKEYEKQKKIIDKVQKKRDKAKKSPSGFAKPCKISDVLCDFIGVPHGTEKSRTEITRFINSYVKEHNLNNPTNKREFFPDKKLNAILNVKDNEKVTYFVLQRLISHHFPLSIAKQQAVAK